MDSDAVLIAKKLHKRYRLGGQNLHVLRGVDLEVRPGEWVAILGASGSGKSTLLHILGGLDYPDQGRALFKRQDIFGFRASALDKYRRSAVGFIFQLYHLLPELSALENVLIGAMMNSSWLRWPRHRKAIHARSADLLHQVGLGERIQHRPSKLSGGERQRVAIARALINEPDVLLADEPTGNLDVDTGSEILKLLSGLHDQSQTIVMVTHDERIASAADRCLLLENGKLVGVT